MAGFETYTSRVAAPGPQALPQLDDRSATAAATMRAGQVLGGFGEQLKQAQGAAQKARATTAYLEGAAQLDKEFENDPDPATAAERYAEREAKLREDQLGTVADETERDQLRTQLTRYGTVNQSQARGTFLKRQADGFSANLDSQQTGLLDRAGRAGSGTERAAIAQGYFEQVDDGARKGWISQQAAVARKTAFSRTLDDTDAVKLIQENPGAALIALADPTRFTTLTPEVRQARLQQAQARADALGTAEVGNITKLDPVRGMAIVGRVTSREQINQVVARALVPQESSGNPNAVSPKGAAGLTQIMPDTARGVARQMKVIDLEGLDDAGVRQVLKNRPDLALRMGQFHLADLAGRYEGRLAPAFAAYHAGAGAADRWHAAAVEKFGAGYTPAQFASVVPDHVTDGAKKTKDYVTDMFTRLGAAPGSVPNFSQAGAYQALSAVGGEVASQAAEQKRIMAALASVAGEDAGGIVQALKAGYAQDANLISQTRATLTQAAATGNADAGRKLRELDFAERVAPAVREAYGLPPARLEGLIAGEEARLAQAPHVSQPERERLQVMKSVAETISRERNANPVGLLERSGAPVVAMPAQIDAPEMAAALSQRSQQAGDAAQRFGAELKPFKGFEVPAYKAQFEQANADERFRFAASAAANMSDAAYEAAMGQLGADKLTILAGRLSTYDGALGQKVARGAALLKQKGVDDGKAADLKTALAGTLGGSVYPPAVQADLIDASLAVYVADRDGKGALFDASDAKALQSAIESVTGKLVRLNGVKVPVPRGATGGQLETALASLELADLPGGQALGRDGKPVDLAFIRSQARLRPQGFGDGRYLLATPGPQGQDAFVFGADGQPLVVDLMPAIKRAQASWGGSDHDRELAGGLIRGGLRRADQPEWLSRAFPRAPEAGPYATPAQQLDAAQRHAAAIEAELAQLTAGDRVPRPGSPLGGKAIETTQARLDAARAEIARLRGAKP